jgi:site-specific DNA recombinase
MINNDFTPRRVAIYARFSTDMQNPTSAADQIAVCERHALREGWKIVARYADEGITGTTNRRPQYQAMRRDMREGRFDLLMAESMDRVSRDQADSHELFKHCKFHRVILFMLDAGVMDALKLSFSSLMNAEQIEKLRHHVRRGLGEKVRKGTSAGGLSYGYRVPRHPNGDRVTGALEIVEEEASVVRRIMSEYAAGEPPKRIAVRLNEDEIPSPSGGMWKMNTILGNRARGTGILNNELYVGQRVWGRLTYLKDPESGQRVSRLNDLAAVIRVPAPEMRIVPDELWEAVKKRQAGHDEKRRTHARSDRTGLSGSQSLRRAKYLLSGLLQCGRCGGPMTVAGSAPYYYCANEHEKGPKACLGMKGIRVKSLQVWILGLLRDRLMQPDAVEAFLADYRQHHEVVTREQRDRLKTGKKTLEKLTRQIEQLVMSVANGHSSPALLAKLRELEDQKATLEERLAADDQVEPPIFPADLAARYRAKVDDLAATLSAPEQATEASEVLRGLIDRIVIHPGGDAGHQIELIGELPALLSLASNDNAAAITAAGSSLKLVAGRGFEPLTFRL